MNAAEVQQALSAPFDVKQLKYRPGATSGDRAMVLWYIDSRGVQDRLDAVVGAAGWQDEYNLMPDGIVICKLSVVIDGTWISKMDVGGPSDQPDPGDRMKAAFSDALKRVAVKFGIGRYLGRFPRQWCDYDAKKKQFVNPPPLPGVQPAAQQKPAAAPAVTTPAQAAPSQPAPAPQSNSVTCINVSDQTRLKQLIKQSGRTEADLMIAAKHDGKMLAQLPQSEFEKAERWLLRVIENNRLAAAK